MCVPLKQQDNAMHATSVFMPALTAAMTLRIRTATVLWQEGSFLQSTSSPSVLIPPRLADEQLDS